MPSFAFFKKGVYMATILFNAFSFLQKKLQENNYEYSNVKIDIVEGETVMDIIESMGLEKNDVEGIFVNGKIKPFDALLLDGDRVALFPPGVPGPYRVLLGIIKSRSKLKDQ